MQNLEVEDTYFNANRTLRVGDKLLDLSQAVVMGIINTTPDSFYSKSRSTLTNEILPRVNDMLTDGASIIDIGGYSSRPGAENVSQAEEIKRVTPIISAISKHFPNALISIDTFRGKVAEAAIESGAHIINDISGFEIDPTIAEIAGKHCVPYTLMHMRGTPQTMQNETSYNNLFSEIMHYFTEKIAILKSLGVKDIIIDPGFGFAKTTNQNHHLLKNMDAFNTLNLPILAGISRKSMIYKKLGISPEDSLNGTIALNAIALSKGANILRVHDVKEATELIRLLSV
ncbi:MAG: dihydropteroate synthase [Crocinitomicaceae bacterium]|nr:dihydropteroate synthase [Crocinitomicaceae bacterium]